MSGTRQTGRTEAAELLAAGAVLPPDPDGAGEQAVPLTARAYRHQGLDGRVVVRLVAAELGAAEDVAAGFLGLEPDGEAAEVGLGLRQSLGFPEWVLAHHPADGHHALDVLPELDRVARQAESKPKAALDAYVRLAGQLAASVPHFLPTFYEQAGRVFLGAGNAAYAAQMFARARKSEAENGLTVDEDRLDAVFLEFALAGALPVKVLSSYAKELAARVPAAEAFRRFRRLSLRRTAGGLPPSARMTGDLRKLAKATGADPAAQEQAYLAELLALPATLRAGASWWKAHLPALVALARREPALRPRLLELMPSGEEQELPAQWLELLEKSGAAAGLWDTALPERERPADGAVGWLGRFLAFRDPGRLRDGRLPQLYPLVERMAAALRAELATTGGRMPVPAGDVDLLDLLLSLDIPVADPPGGLLLHLAHWGEGESEGRRDLVALAADARFPPVVRYGADGYSQDTLRQLAAAPGGRPMLADWVREVAGRTAAADLPQLPHSLRVLSRLPGEALAVAEAGVRAAVGTDLAAVLVRTLRAGLLDELGWPAWEDAAAALVPARDIRNLVVADAWPYLIASGPSQVRVLGAEGTVLTHDLRIPEDDCQGDPGCHYVNGELLVYWRSRAANGALRGYWHRSADRLRPMEGGAPRGTRVNRLGDLGGPTLPLPGGGRTTGSGAVRRGDSTVPGERPLSSDGTSFWVGDSDSRDGAIATWYAYDTAKAWSGRQDLPGFLADATRDAPAGSSFTSGWVLPAPVDGAGGEGLLGWRVVELPDGSLRGEDPAGNTVTVPAGSEPPRHALVFPGAAGRPLAVVRAAGSGVVCLVDQDGVGTAVARTDNSPGTFAAGTLVLPPLRYWHFLRPRDPQGSEALRRIDRETAAALLAAAAGEENAAADGDELPARIRALLPEVGNDALVTGIAAVVRFAAAQRAALDSVAERLDRQPAPAQPDMGPVESAGPLGPEDDALRDALNGLGTDLVLSNYSRDARSGFRQLRSVGHALRDTSQPDPAIRTHLDGTDLPPSNLDWARLADTCAAVALRAAAACTEAEHRDTLSELLGEFDALGVAAIGDPARWRRFQLALDAELPRRPDGTPRWAGLLRLTGGGFLAITRLYGAQGFTALFHDPAGRFEVPAPYVVESSSPVGEAREAGWLAAFRTELAARGPAPWFPAAAEEFARLSGVTPTLARLVVAGLPQVDTYERNFLSPGARKTLGVKAADAAVAKEELSDLDPEVRRAVVAALLPAEPARLWTDGPDVARAAEVWNSTVGR